jgi:broad specificity phosphatase PhoE
MTTLVMLRHADTAWSRAGLLQGRTDVPIDAAAKVQLSLLRVPVRFRQHAVVTSPLQRCVQTARELGLSEVATESRVVEMSWGAWEGRRLRDLRGELGAEMLVNEERGWDFQPPGGESPRQVLARVRPWLEALAIAARPTLAVCHRGVIRVVFAAATQWDMTGRPPAKLDWSALQVFELAPEGGLRVVELNVALEPHAMTRDSDCAVATGDK